MSIKRVRSALFPLNPLISSQFCEVLRLAGNVFRLADKENHLVAFRDETADTVWDLVFFAADFVGFTNKTADAANDSVRLRDEPVFVTDDLVGFVDKVVFFRDETANVIRKPV